VIANSIGTPFEAPKIEKAFRDLIKKNDLPPVVFHSLRHSSITYKLKLSGGDIKSVQGDSGHAQAKMVTDQYSHVLDENRKVNAQLIEDAIYQKESAEIHPKTEAKTIESDDNET
jgi:integrase